MNPHADQTTLVACSILRREVEHLARLHWPRQRLRFLTSMLHMRPDCLAGRLREAVGEELHASRRVLLIYGDCSAGMLPLCEQPYAKRVACNNCYDLLLGMEAFRLFMREGAFFLLPEWAERWREVFTRQLGLCQANAQALMHDMHRKVVYLDTGLVPVPASTIRDCSTFCGLPCEVHPVSLEPLRATIDAALTKLWEEETR